MSLEELSDEALRQMHADLDDAYERAAQAKVPALIEMVCRRILRACPDATSARLAPVLPGASNDPVLTLGYVLDQKGQSLFNDLDHEDELNELSVSVEGALAELTRLIGLEANAVVLKSRRLVRGTSTAFVSVWPSDEDLIQDAWNRAIYDSHVRSGDALERACIVAEQLQQEAGIKPGTPDASPRDKAIEALGLSPEESLAIEPWCPGFGDEEDCQYNREAPCAACRYAGHQQARSER